MSKPNQHGSPRSFIERRGTRTFTGPSPKISRGFDNEPIGQGVLSQQTGVHR